MNIFVKPVKNFSKGRTMSIDAIVVHVAEGNLEQTYSTFQNEEKSSHYFVTKKGDVYRFVDEGDVAFHAGLVVRPTAPLVLERKGINPNFFSVGIENEGHGEDFTAEQYSANATLIADISKRYGIPLDRKHIIGHREIRADKTCPGKVSLENLIALASTTSDICEIKLAEKESLIQQLIAWITNKLK